MIDIQKLRENPDYFKKATEAKQMDAQVVTEVVTLDKDRRNLIGEVESIRAKRNKLSKDDRAQGKALKLQLKDLEPKLKDIEERLQQKLSQIPNPSEKDVKIGKNDTENEIIRTWGTPRKFDFTIKDHLEIGEALDIIDVKRAAKVSGARFYYLKGDGARLEWALLQFGLEILAKYNFIPVIPPVIINKSSMQAMGYMEHGGEEDMFVLDRDDKVLVATSEQSIGPMHMDEVFDKKDLPRRYCGYSACFRREAGSYGKDTRGILRVHQFNKLEMFSYTTPEKGDEEHELLLKIEEDLFQALEIPYQVAKMCTGDLGAPASRKYDIEAWMPSQGKYREVTSTSTTTDFQARRLNTRYREGDKIEYLHMLNGTAFSMGRPIIAILENNQQKDGSVGIPQVLKKWMGKDRLTV